MYYETRKGEKSNRSAFFSRETRKVKEGRRTSVERHMAKLVRWMTSLYWVADEAAYSFPSSSNEGGLAAHSATSSSTSCETLRYCSDSSQTLAQSFPLESDPETTVAIKGQKGE
jgi:hypothetical protein